MNVESKKSPRVRRFSVVSTYLTRYIAEDSLARPNVVRYVGALHDNDHADTHCHVFVELKDARTVAQVVKMFPVEVQVMPFSGIRGDRHSLARAARYLTHESPSEQAKGKYRYPDNAVFAAEGYDWRAAVDALTRAVGHKVPLLDELRTAIIAGTRTPENVNDEYPLLYGRHFNALQRAQKEGERLRQQQEADARREVWVQRQEAARLAHAEASRQQQEHLRQKEPEHIQQQEARVEADRVKRERSQRDAAELAEQRRQFEESPEGIAEQRQREESLVRDSLVAMCRISNGASSETALRSQVRAEIESDLAEFPDSEEQMGFTHEMLLEEFVDGEFTYAGAQMVACWDLGMVYGEPDYLDELHEQAESFRQDLKNTVQEVKTLEYHAAEDDKMALQRAISIRRIYSKHPDLVTLPRVRADLPVAARRALVNAGNPETAGEEA